MDTLVELYGNLTSTEVTVPALEMLLLLAVLTVCLVCRFTRSGLLFSFLGTYRWAWLLLRDEFAHSNPIYLYAYFGFGIAVVILAVITWMLSGD
jgi:hypothetical protein